MNIILDPGSTFTTGSGKFKKKYTEDELYPFTYTATSGGVITFSVNPVPDIPVTPARWTIPGSSDSAIEIDGTVYNPYYNFSDVRGYFFPNTTPEFTSASIIEFEPDEYDQTTGTFKFLDDSYTLFAGPFIYRRDQDGLLSLSYYSNFPRNSKYLYQNNPAMFRLFYDQANQGFLTLTNGVETWVNDAEQSSTIVIRQPVLPRLLDRIPSPSPVSPPAFSPSPRGSALTATPLPFPESKLLSTGIFPDTIFFNSGSTYLSGTGYVRYPRISGVSNNPVRNFTYTTVASTGVITFNGTGTQTTDYLPWGQEILVTSPIQNGGTGIWNSDPATGLRIVLLQMIDPGTGTTTVVNRQYTAIGAPSPSPPPQSDVPPLRLVMRGDSTTVITLNPGSTYTSGTGSINPPLPGSLGRFSKPFTYSAGSAPNSIVITGTNALASYTVSGTATWNTNRSTGLVATFNYQNCNFNPTTNKSSCTPGNITNVAFDAAYSPSPGPSLSPSPSPVPQLSSLSLTFSYAPTVPVSSDYPYSLAIRITGTAPSVADNYQFSIKVTSVRGAPGVMSENRDKVYTPTKAQLMSGYVFDDIKFVRGGDTKTRTVTIDGVATTFTVSPLSSPSPSSSPLPNNGLFGNIRSGIRSLGQETLGGVITLGLYVIGYVFSTQNDLNLTKQALPADFKLMFQGTPLSDTRMDPPYNTQRPTLDQLNGGGSSPQLRVRVLTTGEIYTGFYRSPLVRPSEDTWTRIYNLPIYDTWDNIIARTI